MFFYIYKKHSLSEKFYFHASIPGCLKMGRNTFAFNNVVNVEKIDEIFKILKEGKHTFDDVQYFTCYVEQGDERNGRTHVKGMVQFGMKREIPDARRWFKSTFGNMLWWRLGVLPPIDANNHYNYVNQERAEVENGRTFEFGELKGYGKKRGHGEVEEEDDGTVTVFDYFVVNLLNQTC